MKKLTKTMSLLLALLVASAFTMAQHPGLSTSNVAEPLPDKEIIDQLMHAPTLEAPKKTGAKGSRAGCPAGTVSENEPCGEDLNGGCNDEDGGYPFQSVNLGDIICGTTWSGGGMRDTDWFVIELSDFTDFTLNASQVDIPMFFYWLTITPPCNAFVAQSLAVPAGGSGSMALGVLAPGTYYFWAGPQSFTDVNPCENIYLLEFAGATVQSVPLSNWALYLGIMLMLAFTVIRLKRMM